MSKVKVGDIILYRTDSALKCAQRYISLGSTWDHVGIVCHDYNCGTKNLQCCSKSLLAHRQAIGERDANDPYSKPWHTLEAVGTGVDTYPLTTTQLEDFAGVIGWHQLVIPEEMRPKMEATLASFVSTVKGMPYQADVFELLKATGVDIGASRQGELGAFFCSELVAAALGAMGVLTEGTESELGSTEHVEEQALGSNVIKVVPDLHLNLLKSNWVKSNPMLSDVLNPGQQSSIPLPLGGRTRSNA